MKPQRKWGAVFKHALDGIFASFKAQRNLRVHGVAAVLVTGAALFFRLPPRDISVLMLVIALVISLELVNTAIEATVDLVTPEWHKLAKMAKDAAAGAVLVAAVFAIIIGLLLFYEPVLHWLGFI